MLRVDLERREVVASVRDLCRVPRAYAPSRDALGSLRADLGSAVHRRHRRTRERDVAGFSAEVTLRLTHTFQGFTLRLVGRADGLIERTGEPPHVEEVKSLTAPGADLRGLTPEDLPEATRQVRLYALMLARSRGLQVVRATLVLVSLLDGKERVLEVPFDASECEALLERLLGTLLESVHARAARAGERQALGRLPFPYPEPRPHQQALIDAMARGLAAGRPVLAEAPTGIGKTVAALLPGLRYVLKNDALLMYLTAKRTQRERVATTFESIAAAASPGAHTLSALTLRARTDMCPTGTLRCDPAHCALLAGLEEEGRRGQALEELGQGQAHVTPEAVLEVAARHGLCPHVLSLMLCARVDLVIGDFNHIYASSTEPGLFPGELIPRRVVVVVDEAHNLFDRAREYDSPFLARTAVSALLQGPEGGTPVGDELVPFARALLRLIDGSIEEALAVGPAPALDGCSPTRFEGPALDRLAERCGGLMLRTIQRYGIRRGADGKDPVLEVLQTLVRVRELHRKEDPALVPYVACRRDGVRGRGVGICCVDPAKRLAARHRQVAGTVAMSGTLSPLEHYRRVLGFADLDPVELSLPSPFPKEHCRVVVVPTVRTTWRERGHYSGAIAQVIESVTAVEPGHYAAYFPSFGFLETVRAYLPQDRRRLLVQRPRMSDEQRETILRRLQHEEGPLLLLAVAGGIFAEGIDLPGRALIGAIVVGPALPRVGFEREAMRSYFDDTGEGGFAHAMLYPGMQRVVQAAGRVQRSPDDRGVIVLLDRRFAQSPYADCIPSHWHRYGVNELITQDPAASLTAFWRHARPEPVADRQPSIVSRRCKVADSDPTPHPSR